VKRMNRMEVSELIERFIQAAHGYEEELERPSARRANRHTATGDRIVEELKRRGAEQALLGLFDHPIPIVRSKAATYALDFAPEAAVPVLEDIENNLRGYPAVHAMTSLLMWKDADISRMNVSELIDRFADSAEAYRHAAEGFEGADEQLMADEAQRYSARGHEVIEELERRGAERELLPLFEHARPIVRVWAARYALGFAPEAAVPVLEASMRDEDTISTMEAKAALDAWRDETQPN
jgi:hypothetical protein